MAKKGFRQSKKPTRRKAPESVVAPKMIRCLALLPFNILCHKCDVKGCRDEIKHLKVQFKGVEVLIHAPTRIGENEWSSFPFAKWKDSGLIFSHSGYNPEADLPRPQIKDITPGYQICNAYMIDFPGAVDRIKVDKVLSELIEVLSSNIRFVTKQYWISPSVQLEQVMALKYLFVLDTPKWSLQFTTTKFPVYTSYIESEVLNNSHFREVIANLSSPLFDYEEVKLLDSVRNFAAGLQMDAMVDLSLSAEIAKNRLLERIWDVEFPGTKPVNNKYVKLGFHNYDLPEHVSKHLKTSRVGLSFKDDHPDEYKLIKQLWRYRCQAAHGSSSLQDLNRKRKNITKKEFESLIAASILLREYCSEIDVL